MITAFRQLHRFYREFDRAQSLLEMKVGVPACIPGCGRCCQASTLSCMAIEAMNAVSILTGEGNLSRAVSLAEGWLLEKHNEAPSYEGMITGGFVPVKIRSELSSLQKLPCPFLTEVKECLIYNSRPLACRAFGVTCSGEEICPRPRGKGETLTQMDYIPAPILRLDIESFKRQYRESHPQWVVFGLLPTLIFRAAEEKKFREMVHDNRIATAKIIGSQVDNTLMWQPQVDLLRKGVLPDLVLEAT